MRVIAGKARRLQLKTPKGMQTRPTTDRIRETLFNMIQSSLADARFLDLFSGSGAIGIEALSRGADSAWFVEQDRAAAQIIRDNLKHTHLEDQAEVMQTSAVRALQLLHGQVRFDIVFMDPPYRKGLETEILTHPLFLDLLAEDATVIVEASLDTELTSEAIPGLRIRKTKVYKTNQHVFLERDS